LKKQDIEVGETYLFVGSDSPKRAHLAGHPFTVSSIEKVYRKIAYRKGKRSMKVTRFFNDDGVGARAEELEELPKTGFYQCKNEDCRKWSRVQDLTVPGCPEYLCLHCGHTAANGVNERIQENGTLLTWDLNAGTMEMSIEMSITPADDTTDRGHGFCPKCDYPLTSWGAASDGDGDIYDEIGCDRCEEVVRKEHASYCTCAECDPWGLKADAQDLEANKTDNREFPCTECETGEMKFSSGGGPNGIETYQCTECGHTAMFP